MAKTDKESTSNASAEVQYRPVENLLYILDEGMAYYVDPARIVWMSDDTVADDDGDYPEAVVYIEGDAQIDLYSVTLAQVRDAWIAARAARKGR